MSEKRKVNILMIDKQGIKLIDLLVEFLNMSAEQHQYTVTNCDSYIEALSMLDTEDKVDIALVELDLTKEYFMPGDKDFLPWIKEDNAGYRILAHLKKEYPGIKVLMLVDYPACEDPQWKIKEISNKGADSYLVKPFVISKLVEEILSLS